MWYGKRLSTGVVIFLMTIDVSGQSMTLIPDRSATINAYSLGEWIAQASGLGWVSYDRIQGTISANAVFVRGMPISTEWNGNAWFGLPNWAIADLDSVVIHEPGSVVHGFAAPDGAIDVYPRVKSGLSAEFGAVNATKDPGTLSGTPYSSPNVERIREYAHLAWIRDSGFTRIDVTTHSYSVGLGLDGKPYGGLYDRTYDPSQPDLFPYQTRVSVAHGQRWVGTDRRTEVVAVAHADPQQYIWDDGLGRETSVRTFGGHIAIRNEPVADEGWRWIASGGGIEHRVIRFEPTDAEPLEASYRAVAGYTTQTWDANILASELGGGFGFGLRGQRWRTDAVIETHQQLISLSTNQRWFRARASIANEGYYRFRVDVTGGLGMTYLHNQVLGVDWRKGIGFGTHRLDAVAAWSTGNEFDPRFSTFLSQAVWRWQAHPTFGLALSAGYRSARQFDGAPFEHVPGHTDIRMNLHQTLFRGRLRAELGFRNLLDQMDTDHPDGLIHPMSVEVRMRLTL